MSDLGCALSSVIACLWCASGCSAQRVGAHFAFFPPDPPTYSIGQDEGGNTKLRLHLRVGGKQERPHVRTHVKLIETINHQRIPVFSFRVPQPRCVMLFSHGNAMDCGIIFHYWVEMAHRLNCDIFAYDYTGYGVSTGVPSEEDTYADILAVYDHLVTIGVSPKAELIVYGQSVGTGPSCHLAAHRPIAGLVLHSPMVTGIRVISNQDGVCAPASVFRSCDLFPNVRHIPKIAALTLIMHGTKDEVIDVAHAEHLLSKWPAAIKHEPYIVPGAGHDDVFETDPEEFYRRLLEFIHAATNNQSFTTTPPKAMTSPPIHPAKASDKLTRAF